MKPSELRGKIKEQLYTAVFDVTEHTRLHHDEIKPDTVPMDKLTDAILDAVIASLPHDSSHGMMYEPGDFGSGYDCYRDITIELLQSAKSTGKESE